jgi:hypothetical protein
MISLILHMISCQWGFKLCLTSLTWMKVDSKILWLWYHYSFALWYHTNAGYDINDLWYHRSMISSYPISMSILRYRYHDCDIIVSLYDITPMLCMISMTYDIIGQWYHTQYHTQYHTWYHDTGWYLWYHVSETMISMTYDIIGLCLWYHKTESMMLYFWNYDINCDS